MVKIDTEKCIGCGACVSACSEIFKMGDDGKARVKSHEDSKCIKEAIGVCPVGAISE